MRDKQVIIPDADRQPYTADGQPMTTSRIFDDVLFELFDFHAVFTHQNIPPQEGKKYDRDGQCRQALKEHGKRCTYGIRRTSDEQAADRLHAEERHRIVADHPTPHSGRHRRLNNRVADRGLCHHPKTRNGDAQQCQRKITQERKREQAHTEQQRTAEQYLFEIRPWFH